MMNGVVVGAVVEKFKTLGTARYEIVCTHPPVEEDDLQSGTFIQQLVNPRLR